MLYGTAEDPDAQLRSDFPEKVASEIEQGNALGENEGSSGVRSTAVRDRKYKCFSLMLILATTMPYLRHMFNGGIV